MENNNGKTLAIVGLILGIVSIVLAWFMYVNIAAVACAVVGLILSIKGKNKLVAAGQAKGLAVAGLIVSIVGLVLSVIMFFACTVCVSCAACAASNDPDVSSALNELSSLVSSVG